MRMEDDDDLEALRLAALRTIKSRNPVNRGRRKESGPFFRPSNNPNLIAIVPQEAVTPTQPSQTAQMKRDEVPNKFSRIKDSDSESEDDTQDEEEPEADEEKSQAEAPPCEGEDVLSLNDEDEDDLEKLMDKMEKEFSEVATKKVTVTSTIKKFLTEKKNGDLESESKEKKEPVRKSPVRTRKSPRRSRSPSPRRKPRSRTQSPYRTPSPRRKLRRSYSRSPRRRSLSPRRRTPLRRRSPSPRRRSPSPRWRSPSPRRRSLSPRRRSPSPRRRSPSPRRRTPRRSVSPRSPLRRHSNSPRRIPPRRRSPSPPKHEDKRRKLIRSSPPREPKRVLRSLSRSPDRRRSPRDEASKQKNGVKPRDRPLKGSRDVPPRASRANGESKKEENSKEEKSEKPNEDLDPIMLARKKKFESNLPVEPKNKKISLIKDKNPPKSESSRDKPARSKDSPEPEPTAVDVLTKKSRILSLVAQKPLKKVTPVKTDLTPPKKMIKLKKDPDLEDEEEGKLRCERLGKLPLVVEEVPSPRKTSKKKDGKTTDLRAELSRRRAQRLKGMCNDPMFRIVQSAFEGVLDRKPKALKRSSSPNEKPKKASGHPTKLRRVQVVSSKFTHEDDEDLEYLSSVSDDDETHVKPVGRGFLLRKK